MVQMIQNVFSRLDNINNSFRGNILFQDLGSIEIGSTIAKDSFHLG